MAFRSLSPPRVRNPATSHSFQVINQLLLGTAWGELEYLIIDMPPGTDTAPSVYR